MGLESKRDAVLGLFFNEGTRQWHFRDIVRAAKISEERANRWLKEFLRLGIIRRVKPRGKMPYFIADFSGAEYKNRKRLFALDMLVRSGFVSLLQSEEKADAIIIFGSFARADWYSDSDIDVFIKGEVSVVDEDELSKLAGRDVHLHVFRDRKDISTIRSGLVQNIVNGYFIKGSVQDIVEVSV